MSSLDNLQQLCVTEHDNTLNTANDQDSTNQRPLKNTASLVVARTFTQHGVVEAPFDREECLRNWQALIENSRTRRHFSDTKLAELFRGYWYRPPELESVHNLDEQKRILQEHNQYKQPFLNMRKLYLLVRGSNKRYAQWMGRAIREAINKGAITESGDAKGLMKEKPKKIQKLHVKHAMILLTYGPNAIYNRDLLRQLSEYTGVPIPPPCRARAEQRFAMKLKQLIEDLGTSSCSRFCELEEQVKIENYRVDFIVKVIDEGIVSEQFILEFDEAYHQTVRQQRKDRQRDAHLQQLGYKIIRVKESEADDWLRISNLLDYPLHEPTIRRECIEDATYIHPRTKQRYISVDSINNWDAFDRAVTANLIKDTNQKLAQFAKLLDAEGLPYRRSKMLLDGKEQRVLRLLCE